MKKPALLAGIFVSVAIVAFVAWPRSSPVWCQPDGHCAPTHTFAPGNYPIEFKSECAGGDSMIQYGSRGYIRDPDQSPSRAFDVSYDADASLPTDATDTGWSSEDRQLWISPASDDGVGPTSIFIVYDDHVERWPWLAIGCQ